MLRSSVRVVGFVLFAAMIGFIVGCPPPNPSTGTGSSSTGTTIQPLHTLPGAYSLKINGVEFNFVMCPQCDSFQMPINFGRSQGESIDQVFYIMDTELTIAQYEALRTLNPDLPDINEFNKNCETSDRNSVQIEYKFQPLHGIVPLDDKDSSEGLRYAQMICDTLTDAINSGKAELSKDIKSLTSPVTVSIPTTVQWYYAAAAVNDPIEMPQYCHLGTIEGRDYVHENCQAILNESPAASSLEAIQVTYMNKFWQEAWSSFSSEVFNATPDQIITMIDNKEILKIKDDRENINDIVKNMPLTYLRCLLFDRPAESATYLFISSFTTVKEGELPNNWKIYDVHTNASELVLDPDSSAGYCVMGGQNNLSMDSGWEDNWQRYLLWKKVYPRHLDKHTMPGLRLIITVE